MISKILNFCSNSIKRQRQPQMTKINKLSDLQSNSRIYGKSGGIFEGGGLIDNLQLSGGGLFEGGFFEGAFSRGEAVRGFTEI